MGFAMSWIAVRGKSPDAVLADVGYRRTGEQEDVAESPAVCATLGTGWFILVLNNSMEAFDGTIDLAALSRDADVVACMVEEHVMVSGFSSWKGGTRVLTVGHDADRGIRHLDVEGALPPEFRQIVDEAMRAQASEDAGEASTDYVFDIPVDMAHRLTGFRHDRDPEGGAMYDVLEKEPSAERRTSSWWRGLFGKRAT